MENDAIENGGDGDVAVSFAEDAFVGVEVAIAALAKLNFLIDRTTSKGQAVHADLSSCMTCLISALEELDAKIPDLPELFKPARAVISEG